MSNYFIEKHDMEIILDALNMLRSYMKETRGFALNLPYTEDDVDSLFQSLDSGNYDRNGDGDGDIKEYE